MRPDREPPSGAVRAIAPAELFFSMTDGAGVITAVNSVFGRLSGFGREDLLGAPHNIIRHPDMPGGVFRLMWDTLADGRPFAGYVRNLARDGAAYDVFATVTPVDGGFLSVRTAASDGELRERVHGLYGAVLAHEQAERASGASAADAAVSGAQEILRLLATEGFGSYDEFAQTVMPAEVMARATAAGPVVRPAGGGPAGEVLDAALEVAQALGDTLVWLDELAELAEALRVAAESARETAADLWSVTELAREASVPVASSAPVLVRTSEAMSRIAADLVANLLGLATDLAEVRAAVVGQRFGIALARLHDDTVILFAREVLVGEAPAADLRHVPALCRVLCDDMDALTRTTRSRLRAVREASELACDQLARFQTFLSTWRLQVPRFGVSAELGPHVGPVDGHLGTGRTRIAALRELAERCVAGGGPVDTGALVGPVWRMLQAADASLADAAVGSSPGVAVGAAHGVTA